MPLTNGQTVIYNKKTVKTGLNVTVAETEVGCVRSVFDIGAILELG